MNKLPKLIPYRFSVIRFIPDSFRDEPSNIGLFLQCEDLGFVCCRFEPKHPRLRSVDERVSSLIIGATEEFQRQINLEKNYPNYKGDIRKFGFIKHLSRIYNGLMRFSEPITAICEDPRAEFERLYKRLVQ